MTEPLKESVKAKSHTAQYQMHKYFARRPYNVFRRLIEHYTKKGDIVLDCFCGGGVTVFESLALDRKVIGVDINPLASFITEMQIQQTDTKALKKYFDDFLSVCRREFEDLYRYQIDGEEICQEWMEWVYEVKCAECGTVIRLTEENKLSNGIYKCQNEACPTNQQSKRGVSRTKCVPYRSVPLRIKYRKRDDTAGIHDFDEQEREKLTDTARSYKIPEGIARVDARIPHNWDRWYEDCLPQKGVYCFSDLFSKRNYYVNSMIFDKIISMPDSKERDLLYFAFSSSLRYTNKMARVTQNWENGNPACMDKHAYWLPNIYVECNVLDKLEDRMAAVIKGLDYTLKTIKSRKKKAENFAALQKGGDYMILTQSASKLPIPDESIDVIITDPPYGSNVQYGELSSFWNIWYKEFRGLDQFIYNDEEAVANRKSCFPGAKDASFYGKMLTEVYTEAGRVLKPGGYLVFTFNNKNINVWIQLLRAVVHAGFYLPKDGVIYQDFVEEYKNTSHLRYSGNIHGDFIYSFRKGNFSESEITVDNFEETVQERINICLREMYESRESYTTTQLYEKIYGSLIALIMQFVRQNEEDGAEKIEKLSNKFIDSQISRNLVLNDGRWFRKEGAQFADRCY